MEQSVSDSQTGSRLSWRDFFFLLNRSDVTLQTVDSQHVFVNKQAATRLRDEASRDPGRSRQGELNLDNLRTTDSAVNTRAQSCHVLHGRPHSACKRERKPEDLILHQRHDTHQSWETKNLHKDEPHVQISAQKTFNNHTQSVNPTFTVGYF